MADRRDSHHELKHTKKRSKKRGKQAEVQNDPNAPIFSSLSIPPMDTESITSNGGANNPPPLQEKTRKKHKVHKITGFKKKKRRHSNDTKLTDTSVDDTHHEPAGDSDGYGPENPEITSEAWKDRQQAKASKPKHSSKEEQHQRSFDVDKEQRHKTKKPKHLSKDTQPSFDKADAAEIAKKSKRAPKDVQLPIDKANERTKAKKLRPPKIYVQPPDEEPGEPKMTEKSKRLSKDTEPTAITISEPPVEEAVRTADVQRPIEQAKQPPTTKKPKRLSKAGEVLKKQPKPLSRALKPTSKGTGPLTDKTKEPATKETPKRLSKDVQPLIEPADLGPDEIRNDDQSSPRAGVKLRFDDNPDEIPPAVGNKAPRRRSKRVSTIKPKIPGYPMRSSLKAPTKKPAPRRRSSQKQKPTLPIPEPEPEVHSDHELEHFPPIDEGSNQDEPEDLHSDQGDDVEEAAGELARQRKALHHERRSGIPYIARPQLRVPNIWARHLHEQVPVTRRGTFDPIIQTKYQHGSDSNDDQKGEDYDPTPAWRAYNHRPEDLEMTDSKYEQKVTKFRQIVREAAEAEDFKMMHEFRDPPMRSRKTLAASILRMTEDSQRSMKNQDSNSTTVTRKSERRKIDLLELAHEEAQIEDMLMNLGDSDPLDEVQVYTMSKKLDQKRKILKYSEDVHKKRGEKVMSMAQRVAKWAVVLVAIVSFLMALQDIYEILLVEMKTEYLFITSVYNCYELIMDGNGLRLIISSVHAAASLSLLYMENKHTSDFAFYWIISQVFFLYSLLMVGFFEIRFVRKHAADLFLTKYGIRICWEVFQIITVVFRYYKLHNPFHDRLLDLAAATKPDTILNSELHLRTSPFLQSKAAARQAATFETLAVVKKLKTVYRTTGMKADPQILFTEISKAVRILNEEKKYNVGQRSSVDEALLEAQRLDAERRADTEELRQAEAQRRKRQEQAAQKSKQNMTKHETDLEKLARWNNTGHQDDEDDE